jgi:hypothetical protein
MGKNIFWISPITVMAIGFLPMPYGYYSVTRLVVSGCAIYFAYQLYCKNQIGFALVFGMVTAIYNPIIPLHLYKKEIWVILNLATMILFAMKRGDALK